MSTGKCAFWNFMANFELVQFHLAQFSLAQFSLAQFSSVQLSSVQFSVQFSSSQVFVYICGKSDYMSSWLYSNMALHDCINLLYTEIYIFEILWIVWFMKINLIANNSRAHELVKKGRWRKIQKDSNMDVFYMLWSILVYCTWNQLLNLFLPKPYLIYEIYRWVYPTYKCARVSEPLSID